MLLLIRSVISYAEIPIRSRTTLECIAVKMMDAEPMLLINVYIPPPPYAVTDALRELTTIIDDLQTANQNFALIILGDFNCLLANWNITITNEVEALISTDGVSQ